MVVGWHSAVGGCQWWMAVADGRLRVPKEGGEGRLSGWLGWHAYRGTQRPGLPAAGCQPRRAAHGHVGAEKSQSPLMCVTGHMLLLEFISYLYV